MATASETTETSPATEIRVAAPPEPPPTFPAHRLTIERYERLVEAGVYRDGEPIFLWHGRLVEKMTKGRPHAIALIALNGALGRLMQPGSYLQPEQPIAIDQDGLPEPDLAVIRGTLLDHLGRNPTAQEVALIIEIADSSLRVDSGDVLETYAAQGIPVYWLVNIPKSRIEVYRDPTGRAAVPGYRECRQYGHADEVPVVLDGVEVGRIAVADVLPRA